MPSDPTPHPVDLHVGARLRIRRRTLGLSQTTVAQAVGLTFQQLQKYERGANRISASKLFAMAQILSTSVSWFFEGLPDPAVAEAELSDEVQASVRAAQAFLTSSEGLELARLFPTVPKAARRQILDLCQAMVDDD